MSTILSLSRAALFPAKKESLAKITKNNSPEPASFSSSSAKPYTQSLDVIINLLQDPSLESSSEEKPKLFEKASGPATPQFHPINQTIKILTSRSVPNPKGSPQSYTWQTYMNNQLEFMSAWSLGEALGVLGDAYNKTASKKPQDSQICTNPNTLFSSRFIPAIATPTDLESEEAKAANALINGQWNDSVVGHFLGLTETHCGKLAILLTAANPTANRDILERRYQTLLKLRDDSTLRSQLADILAAYAKNETRLLSQFDPKGSGTKKPGRIEQIMKPPLFETLIPESWAEKYRQSPFCISANDLYKTGYELFTTASKVAGGALLLLKGVSSLTGGESANVLQPYIPYAAATVGGIQLILKLINNETIANLTSLLIGPDSIEKGRVFGSYTWADANIKKMMQHVMVEVAQCLRAMNAMYESLHNSAFRENLDYFDKLEALITSEEPEIINMLSMAITYSTLDSKSESGVFASGPVLCLWDIIQGETTTTKAKREADLEEVKAAIRQADTVLNNQKSSIQEKKAALESRKKAESDKKIIEARIPEVKRLILDAMSALGEIDFYLTMAKTQLTSTPSSPWSILPVSSPSTHKFSIEDGHFSPLFASLQKAENRKVRAADPLLLNTINLPPITIITAENGAGKTTFSLNWINNIFLRQSLGVTACAESSSFPIYDRVFSSRGIKDSNTQSSFQATEAFVQDIKQALTNHPKKQFFLLFDELYKDTDPEKAAQKLKELEDFLHEQHKKHANFHAVFITHSQIFARLNRVETAKMFTTEKTVSGSPSGILTEGVYAFNH